VRETLRTSKLPIVLQILLQTATSFTNGTLLLTPEGELSSPSAVVPAATAAILLFDVPTLCALCFTAHETVGVASIDDVLKAASGLFTAGAKQLTIAKIGVAGQQSIFLAVVNILRSCISNMKVLNVTLFFTGFQELKLFDLMVKLTLSAAAQNEEEVLWAVFECLTAYIQVPQSENDRKRCESDTDFVAAYRQMMAEIVNPKLKEDRDNRSKFRAILFFSRSLPE
jgi:hypothetical protein